MSARAIAIGTLSILILMTHLNGRQLGLSR
nr:MAG TPA: hypothetical protein [Caudoviricetes sp.]